MKQLPAGAVTPAQAALAAVNDILTVLTSLATGALVFSIGLLAPASWVYPTWVKWVLAATWALFFVSALSGVWAQSLVPLQIQKQQENINDRELRRAAMTLEGCFILGVLLLAVALSATLINTPSRQTVAVQTPIAAIERARAAIGSKHRVISVDTVELLKGADGSRIEQSAWHLRLHVQNATARNTPAKILDVYVNPITSKVYIP